jgi:hypothetical protein
VTGVAVLLFLPLAGVLADMPRAVLDQLRGAGLSVELEDVPDHAQRVLSAAGALSRT